MLPSCLCLVRQSHEQHSALASIAAAADSFPYTPRAARVFLHALAGTSDRHWASAPEGRPTPRAGTVNPNDAPDRGPNRGVMSGVFGGEHTYATSLSASTVAAVAAAAVAHSNPEGVREWSVVRAHDFDQHLATAEDQDKGCETTTQNFVRLSSFDQDAKAEREPEESDAEGKRGLAKEGDGRPGKGAQEESDGVRSPAEKASTDRHGENGETSLGLTCFNANEGTVVPAKQGWRSSTSEADFGIVTIRRCKEE